MTRALVLGGGGPVGIGWEAGLLLGLAAGGLHTSAADAVIGTSAGSVVGFILSSGGDLEEAPSSIGAASAGAGPVGTPPPAVADRAVTDSLIATVAESAADPAAANAIRARLGRLALEARTMTEERWLSMFGAFEGAAWPEAFSCTAVNAEDGSFRVWDRDAAVDPWLAIASSCAVPGVFPPVTIDGSRWMDGGVRDILNADVAAGHDVVLAASCILLDLPAGTVPPAMSAMFAATRAQLEALGAGGSKVEIIVPGREMLEVSRWGLDLMDYTKARAAYAAGVRQGEVEARRLCGFWAP